MEDTMEACVASQHTNTHRKRPLRMERFVRAFEQIQRLLTQRRREHREILFSGLMRFCPGKSTLVEGEFTPCSLCNLVVNSRSHPVRKRLSGSTGPGSFRCRLPRSPRFCDARRLRCKSSPRAVPRPATPQGMRTGPRSPFHHSPEPRCGLSGLLPTNRQRRFLKRSEPLLFPISYGCQTEETMRFPGKNVHPAVFPSLPQKVYWLNFQKGQAMVMPPAAGG